MSDSDEYQPSSNSDIEMYEVYSSQEEAEYEVDVPFVSVELEEDDENDEEEDDEEEEEEEEEEGDDDDEDDELEDDDEPEIEDENEDEQNNRIARQIFNKLTVNLQQEAREVDEVVEEELENTVIPDQFTHNPIETFGSDVQQQQQEEEDDDDDEGNVEQDIPPPTQARLNLLNLQNETSQQVTVILQILRQRFEDNNNEN